MSAPPREKEGFRRRKWEESLGASTSTSTSGSDLTVSYLAGTMTVNTGYLTAGDVTETHTQDSSYAEVSGIVGAEEFRATFDVPRVSDFNNVLLHGRYEGASDVAVEIYNKSTTSWDELGTLPNSGTDEWYSYAVTDASPYISSVGTVQVRVKGVP